MKKLITLFAIAGMVLALAPAAQAAIIAGDTSTASMNGGGGAEENIANEKGLTGSGATGVVARPYSDGARLTIPGWARVDLGTTYTVDTMYVWNYNEDDTGGRGTKDCNIYYSTVVTADASNFASGDWTLFGARTLAPTLSNNTPVTDTIALGGLTARIIGIETITNHQGFSPFTGLGKLQFDGVIGATAPSGTVIMFK